MSIPRLLLLAVLIASCATPALAQSPPAKNHFPAPPLLGTPTPAPALDWQTQIPAFRPSAPTSLQTQPLPALQPRTISRLHASANLQLLAQNGLRATKLRIMAQNNNTCYAIRDYQFKQENPASDATSFTGVSTCQPRASIQMKGAAAVQMRGAVLIR